MNKLSKRLNMDFQKLGLIAGIVVVTLTLLFRWNIYQKQSQSASYSNEKAISTELLTQPSQSPSKSNSSDANPRKVSSESSSNSLILSNEFPLINSPDQAVSQQSNEIPSPELSAQANASIDQVSSVSPKDQRLIALETDTLQLTIDLYGGDIVKAVLPKHTIMIDGEQGYVILNRESRMLYIAQSGLVGPDGTDSAEGRPLFSVDSSIHRLQENQETLTVDLMFRQDNVDIIKRFQLMKGSYAVSITYLISNNSQGQWRANFYGQIKRDNHQPIAAGDSGFGVTPYLGAATTNFEDNYAKFSFKELDKESVNFAHTGGWVAMVQHYFTAAWVGRENDNNEYFLKKLHSQNNYLMGYVAPMTLIEPGQQGEINSTFYVGPKTIDNLEAIAPYLDLTMDFGWLWWIAKPLYLVLNWIHGFTHNWGWAIILLTLLIKLLFFYPSAMSYRSMANMRKVAPKMQAIKERYGDDRQKMSQEMMALYKKEKVNPMGGCLPVLIQMPVFIALYWVLMESVELRHAPFMLWLKDLSVMDPYFILPLLMGLTMFIQQQLNPTPPDPMQAKVMKWMPVAFTFLFLWFPAGLVLYWVTNNTLSIIQQYIITKQVEARGR